MVWWLVGASGGLVLALWLFRRPLRRFGQQVQAERARELFHLQRPRLEEEFLRAASASGKPRGLIWQECLWEPQVLFVRQRHTGQIVALVALNVRFQAIPGSDMENVPAVQELKMASAVFFFERGRWHTVGRAIFNKNPEEAAEHFQGYYERLDTQA